MTHLSRAEQVAALRGFVLGDVSFDELQTRLADYVQFVRTPGVREAHFPIPLEVSIVITPADLLPMLHLFLDWKRSEDELETWASVIQMIDAFDIPPDLSEEEADDLLDPMWEVLSDLSALPLLQVSARQRVHAAVAELEAAQLRLNALNGRRDR